MATAAPEPINILRPGTFVDTHGNRVTVTRDQLVDMAASYDPADPAPFVFGHPKTDDPAMGWVGGLRMAGDTLQAVPGDVTPELTEAVRAKRYRKVSASYYPPNNPANPKPGRFTLKHVGLLGAVAPAIKGLGMIPAFAADDDTAVTIPDQEPPMSDTPDPAIALAEREAAAATRATELDSREAVLVEREASLIAAEKLRVHEDHVAFAEAQVAGAKLAPAGKELIIGLLDQLHPLAVVSFGEADGELAPADALKKLFAGAQPVVALGEAAGADPTAEVAEQDPAKIADQAIAFMESEQAAGRAITIQQAVRHVHRETAAG